MQKLIYIFLSVFIFFACKTQKSSIEYKEIIKVDTFVRTQTNTIYEPINDTLYLPSICDSLNSFNFSKSIPNGRAILSKKGNNLRFIIATNKVLQTSTNQKEKSFNDITKIKEKEIIKYKIPNWILITFFIESVLILGYLYFRFINPFK